MKKKSKVKRKQKPFAQQYGELGDPYSQIPFPKNKGEFSSRLAIERNLGFHKGMQETTDRMNEAKKNDKEMWKERRELINAMSQAATAMAELARSITYIGNSCIPK